MKGNEKFKMYTLYVGNIPVVFCADRWLIELYIVQRKLVEKKYQFHQDTYDTSMYQEFDDYLVYYYGYAVTQRELKYIVNSTEEYESFRKYKIHSLQGFLERFNHTLKKSEKKAIKETIKILKKYTCENDDFIESQIDTILNHNDMVKDYMDATDMFRMHMEGEI